MGDKRNRKRAKSEETQRKLNREHGTRATRRANEKIYGKSKNKLEKGHEEKQRQTNRKIKDPKEARKQTKKQGNKGNTGQEADKTRSAWMVKESKTHVEGQRSKKCKTSNPHGLGGRH